MEGGRRSNDSSGRKQLNDLVGESYDFPPCSKGTEEGLSRSAGIGESSLDSGGSKETRRT